MIQIIQTTHLLVLLLLLVVGDVQAQSSYGGGSYGDYDDDDPGYAPQPPSTIPNDNLYHDYAIRQEAKMGGENVLPAAGGGGLLGGWIGNGLSLGIGWTIGGYYHSSNVRKSLNQKHKQEQKNLYQQYYNDVYTLQQQNNELIVALEQYIAAAAGGKTSSTKPSQQQQRRAEIKF